MQTLTFSDRAHKLAERLSLLAPEEVLTYADIEAIIEASIHGEKPQFARSVINYAMKKAAGQFSTPTETVRRIGIRRIAPDRVHEATPNLVKKVRNASNKHAVWLNTVDADALPAAKRAAHSKSLLVTALIGQAVQSSQQQLRISTSQNDQRAALIQ